MEFLLINHPLDCPMCDKGGECPLQNQAMSTGRTDIRFHEHKREYQKPINISSQVLLDRERCVLCQRCTRFSDEIAGRQVHRPDGPLGREQIGIDPPRSPFNSYFSGNTVQICPVGALTGAQYRFRARPFDLVSTPSACEHCSAGCAQRTDHRRGKVLRRLAGDDPNGQRGVELRQGALGRSSTRPRSTGSPPRWCATRRPASCARPAGRRRCGSRPRGCCGPATARTASGVLTGGRLTVEDSYAYAKFARVVLHTNDIDFRARPLSAEEDQTSSRPRVAGVDRRDLRRRGERAGRRARRAGAGGGVPDPLPAAAQGGPQARARRYTRSRRSLQPGLRQAAAPRCQPARSRVTRPAAAGRRPGAAHRAGAARGDPDRRRAAGDCPRWTVRRRCARGAETGARLVWVPRRAGDRGAVETGCLPNLLPGGRPVIDAAGPGRAGRRLGPRGRRDPGLGRPRHRPDPRRRPRSGQLGALVVAGRRPGRPGRPAGWPSTRWTRSTSWSASSCGAAPCRRRADVVFPVAPGGREGRHVRRLGGPLAQLHTVLDTPAMTDARVLDALARELGVELGAPTWRRSARELAALPAQPRRAARHRRAGGRTAVPRPGRGEAVLATWHHLIDLGSLLDGDQELTGTARPAGRAAVQGDARPRSAWPRATRSPSVPSAARSPCRSAITDMPDGVVWLPTNSPGSTVRRTLGVGRRSGGHRSPPGKPLEARDENSRPGPDAGRLRPRRLVAHAASRSSRSSCFGWS